MADLATHMANGVKDVNTDAGLSPHWIDVMTQAIKAELAKRVPGGTGPLGSNAPDALKAWAPQIAEASRVTGVPQNLIAAQIWQESRGNPDATSTNPGNGKTDSGLVQVNPDTFADLQSKHPELQGKSLSDPQTNIMAGAFLLSDLKAQFGSWQLALRAYNSGPLSVDINNPDVTTTGLGDVTYVQKVTKFANDLMNGVPLT